MFGPKNLDRNLEHKPSGPPCPICGAENGHGEDGIGEERVIAESDLTKLVCDCQYHYLLGKKSAYRRTVCSCNCRRSQ